MTTRDHDLYLAAREAIERGDLNKAVDLLCQSISNEPHFKSHELLGECYGKLGRTNLALREFEKAVQLNPRSEKSQTLLANCLADAGRTEEAKAVLGDLLSRNPTYGPAKRLLSRLQPHHQDFSDQP